MRLSNEREIYTVNGLIGINEDLHIAYGYDGFLPICERPDYMDDDEWEYAEKFSAAEQIEIADEMISRWQRFRARAAAQIVG